MADIIRRNIFMAVCPLILSTDGQSFQRCVLAFGYLACHTRFHFCSTVMVVVAATKCSQSGPVVISLSPVWFCLRGMAGKRRHYPVHSCWGAAGDDRFIVIKT